MKRWLDYQRKYTAEEVKKRTEQFKETQEAMQSRRDLFEKESEKDFKRKFFDSVTHPYQSTVDDLMKSRYGNRLDDSINFPPVKTEVRKTSPGKLTVVEFDDLDRIVVHKRK